jgi:malate synthase
VAREAFDAHMQGPNQLSVARDDVRVTARDLLEVPRGAVTEAGLRQNLSVGLAYLEAWLGGQGCVPLHHLMEDAATAEISRTQVWQWLRHGAKLDDGRTVGADLVRRAFAEEEARLRDAAPAGSSNDRLPLAADLFRKLILAPELEDFLTLPAYEHL